MLRSDQSAPRLCPGRIVNYSSYFRFRHPRAQLHWASQCAHLSHQRPAGRQTACHSQHDRVACCRSQLCRVSRVGYPLVECMEVIPPDGETRAGVTGSREQTNARAAHRWVELTTPDRKGTAQHRRGGRGGGPPSDNRRGHKTRCDKTLRVGHVTRSPVLAVLGVAAAGLPLACTPSPAPHTAQCVMASP